jgi:hypothetical protein
VKPARCVVLTWFTVGWVGSADTGAAVLSGTNGSSLADMPAVWEMPRTSELLS